VLPGARGCGLPGGIRLRFGARVGGSSFDGPPLSACEVLQLTACRVESLVNGDVPRVDAARRRVAGGRLVTHDDRVPSRDAQLDPNMKATSSALVPVRDGYLHVAPVNPVVELIEPDNALSYGRP
jgi:hypothetical protein